MKFFTITMMFVLLFTLGAAEKPFQFASNGKAQCVIALSANAGKFDKMAAADLQLYLGKMTGAKFQIVAETQVKGKAVYVGQSAAAAKAGLKNFKGEEWCISSPDGQKLILTGSKKIGSYYAVWALLNKLGCYALSWDSDAVPQNKNASYNGKFERKVPAFAGRMIFDEVPLQMRYVQADPKVKAAYNLWLLRSRVNGEQVKSIPALYTYGSYNLAQNYQWHSLCHFVDPDKYFKSHPEYFSMNEFGKRFKPKTFVFGGGLCMSNPDVAKVTLESLRAMIKKDRSSRSKEDWSTVYDISTLDASPYICKCPKCVAFSKANGSETDLLLHYINTVAREIRKEYPDIMIRTFGYSASETPPNKIKPESNVIIQLTDKFTVSDPFVPLNSEINKGRLAYFEKWAKSTKYLGIWDYWNIGGTYFNPPRVETVYNALQSDFRYFRKIGVRDLFLEAERSQISTQSFIDLTYFVANQLMVDPDDDPAKLANTFIEYYYGPKAAPAMKKWFWELCDGVKKHKGRQTTMIVSAWSYATPKFMLDSYKMLKREAEALPKDSVYRKHLEWERIPLIWSVLAQRPTYKKYFESHGVKVEPLVNECRNLVRAYIRRYPCKAPGRYDSRFETAFITCAREFPRPEKFKNVPAEDFRMIAWPNFRGVDHLGSKIADDPMSIQGKALKSCHKNIAYHGVHKRLPGKHRFYSTQFCLGNHGAPGHIEVFLKQVAQDEKYHWYRIPGKFEFKPQSFFWGQGWAVQANTSHLYVLTDGSAEDNTWDEVWFSAKFTGPEYVKGSKKENAIWIDMMVVTRKPLKK